MIVYVTGNILHDQADAIINTVNTVGVMGKGLALQFKKAFPDNYKSYKAACNNNELSVGNLLITPTHSINPPHYIINFPTKAHWKGKSKIEYIQSGLEALKKEVQKLDLSSVAIPALGSGLGGLIWEQVEQEINSYLSEMPEVEWRVYPPQHAPETKQRVNRTSAKPRMTIGRAAVLGLINEYLTSGLHYQLSLLEVQKLVYFLTASGEKLKDQVHFQKHYYGPYADVLKHVLEKMEGHFIDGFGDEANKSETSIGLRKNAAEQAKTFLESHPETKQRFDEVTRLVDGFQSPYGMELLSTVHWVVTQELNNTHPELDEVIHKIHLWSDRKAKMKAVHIKAAFDRLQNQNWLNKLAPV